ncbi:MAG: RNA polymerase sigma-70 factor [Alistipes sp.]|nr:RNA polymerase sigma-70 factor [Alistipes sp.]
MLFKRKEHLRDFEKFFVEYYPRAKAFARKILMSEEDAEDITQDIFLKLMDKPDIWRDKQKRDRYLFVMLRNHIFNLIKRRKVERRYQGGLHAGYNPTEDLEIEEKINEKELELFTLHTVDNMPEQRKIIFRLSRYEAKSNLEIAEALGLSVRTVERHIYLALADLKKVLKSYLPVE